MVLITLTRGRVGEKISKLNLIPMNVCKIYDQPSNGFGFGYSL